jgi:predicted enzyme related to lactoylglutathione lyase
LALSPAASSSRAIATEGDASLNQSPPAKKRFKLSGGWVIKENGIKEAIMKTERYITLGALLLAAASLWSTRSLSLEASMKETEKVTGIGGVFIKARDPKQMAAWYRTNLGIQTKNGYADFDWREKENPERMGRTVWSLFPSNSAYFGSSSSPYMINYRVANLDRMIEQLKRGGVAVEKVKDYDYGRFTWATDPEGNRIELWEPKGK